MATTRSKAAVAKSPSVEVIAIPGLDLWQYLNDNPPDDLAVDPSQGLTSRELGVALGLSKHQTADLLHRAFDSGRLEVTKAPRPTLVAGEHCRVPVYKIKQPQEEPSP